MLDDTTLSNALGNHAAVLQQVVGWIQRFGYEHYFVRALLFALSGAVIWLAVTR